MSEVKSMEGIEDLVLVDTRVAARILGLAPTTLNLMRVQKRGPAYYKLGKTVRYSTADLTEFATRQDHNS